MLLHRLLSIPVCLLAAATAASAQENLSLADATARALAKSHAIRIERESVAAAEAQITGAYGAYDPQLKLELTARHSRDPITSIFSGAPAGHTAATDNSFGSSLSASQLLRTGAMASLTTSASREG